jgi:hypothetical protein
MVVWQVPVMLLNFAILLFVGGVVGMLRDRAMRALEVGGGWESDDVKVRRWRCLEQRVCADDGRLLLLWGRLRDSHS